MIDLESHKEEIERWKAEGRSNTWIADKYGCSRYVISRRLKRWGPKGVENKAKSAGTNWRVLKSNGEEFPNYKLSQEGLVLNKNFKLVGTTTSAGSNIVQLGAGTRQDIVYSLVREAVWETFNGVIPEGMKVAPKDGNLSNDNLLNLTLVPHPSSTTPEYYSYIRMKGDHEWRSFADFYDTAGPKPFWTCYTRKVVPSKPWGPDNFEWCGDFRGKEIKGHLKVLYPINEMVQNIKGPGVWWKCECLDCGGGTLLSASQIITPQSKVCNCQRRGLNHHAAEDLTGITVGNSIVLEFLGSRTSKRGTKELWWSTRCIKCGAENERTTGYLNNIERYLDVDHGCNQCRHSGWGITTEYAGIRFRSKREAIFAEKLDELAIDWDYEPCTIRWKDNQGMSRRATPDFILPLYGVYVAVGMSAGDEKHYRQRRKKITEETGIPFICIYDPFNPKEIKVLEEFKRNNEPYFEGYEEEEL